MLNILTLFLSYLIGSISFALVVGKLFYKTDVRNYGSGNLGATNVFRVLGTMVRRNKSYRNYELFGKSLQHTNKVIRFTSVK